MVRCCYIRVPLDYVSLGSIRRCQSVMVSLPVRSCRLTLQSFGSDRCRCAGRDGTLLLLTGLA